MQLNNLCVKKTARNNGESSPRGVPDQFHFSIRRECSNCIRTINIPVKSVGINLVLVNYKIRSYDQEIKIRRIQALLEKEKSKNK